MTRATPTPDSARDPELQRIVERVRSELGFPMALLSVAERCDQRCQAQSGWPSDLDRSPAAERMVASCCEQVVATGQALEVPSVDGEGADVGIRSYVGLPLAVCGRVLGALCAIDTRPRRFTQRERGRLRTLAANASARLADMTPAETHADELIVQAFRPAFLEIRNLLNVLLGDVSLLGLALGDVKRVLDLVRNADPTLDAASREQAFRALRDALVENQDLRVTHERLQSVATRLTHFLLALESSLAPGGDTIDLTDAIPIADALARHVTRTVGGVRLHLPPGPCQVVGRRVPTTAAIGAALRVLAEGLGNGASHGIDVAMVTRRGSVGVALRAPDAAAGAYRDVAASLRVHGDAGPGASVRPSRSSVVLTWPRASAPLPS